MLHTLLLLLEKQFYLFIISGASYRFQEAGRKNRTAIKSYWRKGLFLFHSIHYPLSNRVFTFSDAACTGSAGSTIRWPLGGLMILGSWLRRLRADVEHAGADSPYSIPLTKRPRMGNLQGRGYYLALSFGANGSATRIR